MFQVVVEGVYHADPHHGNVLLTEDGRLALLDFGLLGRLDEDTRTGLALLLLALAQNRADDVAELIFSLSLTSTRSDQAGFVQDVRRKLPAFTTGRSSRSRAGHALADLQRAAIRRDIALPTSFALVGKTLAQADSIARILDPELDLVGLIEEQSVEVMTREVERRLEPNRVRRLCLHAARAAARLPGRVGHVVSELERGDAEGRCPPDGAGGARAPISRSIANRIGAAMIVGALLLSSSLLVRSRQGRVARHRRLLSRRRARPLHDLEDHPHARRALRADRGYAPVR